MEPESSLGNPSLVPETQRSSLENEVDRARQALTDLTTAGAAELCLVHCDTEAEEKELLDQLTERARKDGFVTATLSLKERSFEALDDLVRTLISKLLAPTRPGPKPEPGFLTLLDQFVRHHGKKSTPHLERNLERFDAGGDLTSLAVAYVAAESGSQREAREFRAWLNGVDLSRRVQKPIARSSLSAKTAQHALVELTRLIRVLEYEGTALFFSGGHWLSKRTPRQREKAYTVLRELIDNFDNGRGALATRILLTGTRELFAGSTSLASLPPLLGRLESPGGAQPAPPHRSWTGLGSQRPPLRLKNPAELPAAKKRAARALIRISQGLPPTEAVSSMSVGYARIDQVIRQLFEHAEMSGSVFSVLTGDYGTGKTHLLLHLTERALEQGHPVFRLNLERLNFDLGNPQRHLSRLLDQSSLPLRHRPSALHRLAAWVRSPNKLRLVTRTLREISEESTEASVAATRLLSLCDKSEDPSSVIESYLAGRDLERKLGSQSYRQSAYSRFLLWLSLLQRVEGAKGPVLLIDEAENLYTTGVSRSERRTALRSLSFYCGGALPSACVVLAITPKVLRQLKRESVELLDDITEQKTVLEWEDATMLRRRLSRLKPQQVPEFTRDDRRALAERVRETHQRVRGKLDDPEWQNAVESYLQSEAPPRALVRGLIDRLEHAFWSAHLGGSS